MTLRERYEDYWRKCEGLPFHEYSAPCCGGSIKTRMPEPSEHWDTFVTCVHCNRQFFIDVTHEGVKARI